MKQLGTHKNVTKSHSIGTDCRCAERGAVHMCLRVGKASWKRRGVLSRIVGRPSWLGEESVHSQVPGGGGAGISGAGPC